MVVVEEQEQEAAAAADKALRRSKGRWTQVGRPRPHTRTLHMLHVQREELLKPAHHTLQHLTLTPPALPPHTPSPPPLPRPPKARGGVTL